MIKGHVPHCGGAPMRHGARRGTHAVDAGGRGVRTWHRRPGPHPPRWHRGTPGRVGRPPRHMTRQFRRREETAGRRLPAAARRAPTRGRRPAPRRRGTGPSVPAPGAPPRSYHRSGSECATNKEEGRGDRRDVVDERRACARGRHGKRTKVRGVGEARPAAAWTVAHRIGINRAQPIFQKAALFGKCSAYLDR